MTPNFFIIGAAKSGTSSLADYLGQHPEVFMPSLKEPNYFAFEGTLPIPRGPAPARVLKELLYNWSAVDDEEYRQLFIGSSDKRAIGEASVRYLYFDRAPHRIKRQVPEARLVAVLRDPVGRLHSHYNMNRQKQLEPLGLMEALEAEPQRVAEGWGWDWHYRAVSTYAPQLQRYYDLFDRESIAVYLYDDFAAQPVETIRSICRHIRVSDDFVPNMAQRGKVAQQLRSEFLDRWLNWPGPVKDRLSGMGLGRVVRAVATRATKLNYRPAPKLDSGLRRELAHQFKHDIEELSDLLGREINWYT